MIRSREHSGVPVEETGDPCPCCGEDTLVKPRSEKRQCPTCLHVENGTRQGTELRDFPVTLREARRILRAFGYDDATTPGNAANTLRRLAADHDLRAAELDDLLRDLKGVGNYPDGDGGEP